MYKIKHPVADIIAVSGIPRSGTSMMMRMLEAGGMPILTDNVRIADVDNPAGYYEYERVKRLKDGDFVWLSMAKGKAVKVISALLKYLPSTFSYRVIFMQRNLDEVLASQRQMLIRRGETVDRVPDDEMKAIFTQHLEEVTAWLAAQKNFQVLYISYNALLLEPAPLVGEITTFLEMKLDQDRMRAVINPNLYRQRAIQRSRQIRGRKI